MKYLKIVDTVVSINHLLSALGAAQEATREMAMVGDRISINDLTNAQKRMIDTAHGFTELVLYTLRSARDLMIALEPELERLSPDLAELAREFIESEMGGG